jgi:SAM-dependent methyltransferase
MNGNPDALNQHKSKWESLAQEDDRYYVRSVEHEQSDEEYDTSGQEHVSRFIQDDPVVSRRLAPFQEKVVLEIGCGSGRLTKSLARLFKHVVAVDVAPTMLAKARKFVDSANVTFVESDGVSVPIVPETVDFAFSYIVYQHFPSAQSVGLSFGNVHRALRSGGLFKVQIRGLKHADSNHWSWGPHYEERDALALVAKTGFRVLNSAGAGTRSYWLLLEKL